MKNIKIIIGIMTFAIIIANISTISAIAVSMNSGESKIIDFSSEFYSLNGSYSIIGNSSNMDGMNITFDGTKVNISLELGYVPDIFNLTVYGLKQEEVNQVTSTSTSGSSLDRYNASYWIDYWNPKSAIPISNETNETTKGDKYIVLNTTDTSNINLNTTQQDGLRWWQRLWNWIVLRCKSIRWR